MLIAKLLEAGFTSAQQTAFRQGANPRLLNDLAEREWETLYVEAVA